MSLSKKQAIDALVEANRTQVETWKLEHKQVKAVAFHPKGHTDAVAFIIAKPTPAVIDAYKQYDHQGKTKKIDELLIANCVKAGPIDLLNEFIDLKNAVISGVVELLEKLEAEEKEL